MKLNEQQAREAETYLDKHYGAWFTQCSSWLNYFRGKYPKVAVPEHLHEVFPPIVRRVITGLAQQIPSEHRRVHCDPAETAQGRETKDAQARSSERENAHRAAFGMDDRYALRNRRYPPAQAKVIESLLFGLSAGVVLPNDLALAPEPKRRAGEAGRSYELRKRIWEVKKLTQPALPVTIPGILNLLIDPGGEFFIWRFQISTHKAKALLERWGKNVPFSLDKEPTVPWKEVYSDDTRLVFAGDELVKELPGYGFLPLANCLPTKGEPVLYQNSVIPASGPEHMYASIIAGCESVLDDIARKESQLANFISKRVWPKLFLQGDNVPDKFEVDNDPSKVDQLPAGAEFVSPPVPDLPKEVWAAVEHGTNYIEEVSQIDALQGYRQASSGYQEAILAGLASGVLRPYVTGLEQCETEEALLRNQYVYLADALSKVGAEMGIPALLFLREVTFSARIGGKRIRGTLRDEDMDSLHVDVVHEARLPQQRQQEAAFWGDAHEKGGASMRRYREDGLGIEDPEEEEAQRQAEDWLASDEVQAVVRRDIAEEYDSDLAERIREHEQESIERLSSAIRRNQGAGMGGPGMTAPLAQPGQGMGGPAPIRVAGQPTPAATPERELDQIIRQAQRRGVPAGRRTR